MEICTLAGRNYQVCDWVPNWFQFKVT